MLVEGTVCAFHSKMHHIWRKMFSRVKLWRVFVLSWLQMWPQDYWQSLNQAEGLESLLRHNVSDPSLLWQHIQSIAVRRARGRWDELRTRIKTSSDSARLKYFWKQFGNPPKADEPFLHLRNNHNNLVTLKYFPSVLRIHNECSWATC